MAQVQSDQHIRLIHQKLNRLISKDFEAKCNSFLSSHPYYVFGEKGAICDGAICIADNPLPTNAMDRHYEVLKNTTTSDVLPLAFKTSVDKVVFWAGKDGTRQGNRLWLIHITGFQALNCSALVVLFPSNPDFVALIPVLWLWKRLSTHEHFGDTNESMNLTLPAVPFGFHKPGSVPLQLTPFLMPLEMLPEALTSMRQHYIDPATPWDNPCLKRTLLNHVLLLNAKSSSILASSHTGGDSQFKYLVWSALKDYSSEFSMEFPNTLFTGDIVLVHHSSGARIHVELQDGLCHTDGSAQPSRLTHFQANAAGHLIFVSKYKWDFLWTTVKSSDSTQDVRAYLFNRDEIPRQWWDNLTQLETTETETWNASSGFFSDRLIHMDNPLAIVTDLARILSSYATTNAGSFKAQKVINEGSMGDIMDEYDENDDDNDGGDIVFDPDDLVDGDVLSMEEPGGDPGPVTAAAALRHEITIYTDLMNICLQR